MAKLKTELNLTAAQATQVEKLMDEVQPLRQRVMAARKDLEEARSANAGKDTLDQKEAALKTARTYLQARQEVRMRGILTAEQLHTGQDGRRGRPSRQGRETRKEVGPHLAGEDSPA